MKYIKKGRLAAIYQTIAETKNPEPIDLDNASAPSSGGGAVR
jgi:hypothetical protein